jgi:hypothetical protein
MTFFESRFAAILQTSATCLPTLTPPLLRNCMHSIQFLSLPGPISVAGRAEEAIRRTVKGIVRERHVPTQICGQAGLIKLIKTSSVRASPRAFGELKGTVTED